MSTLDPGTGYGKVPCLNAWKCEGMRTAKALCPPEIAMKPRMIEL